MRQATADRLLLMFIPAVLSVGHLLLCIYVAVIPSEGWGWVIVATVDFPFSILVAALFHALPPILSFSLFGTVWWYLLGWLGAKLLIKLFSSASMSKDS